MNIKIVYDRSTQQAWAIRLVLAGEAYGKDNCLTHDKAEPLVEFYDTRHPETDLGQFVSRYYLSTLLERALTDGLCLQGGVPSWSVSGEAMHEVQRWLKAYAMRLTVCSRASPVLQGGVSGELD